VKKLVASLARGAPNAFPLVPAQVIVIVAFQAFASMALVSSLALMLASKAAVRTPSAVVTFSVMLAVHASSQCAF
jgi:hypothetical protein